MHVHHQDLHSFPTRRSSDLPEEIASIGARGVLTHWKAEIKQGIGIKRAERLYAAAMVSIGLTEGLPAARIELAVLLEDRKSTRLNSSHVRISYAVFCLKKKT